MSKIVDQLNSLVQLNAIEAGKNYVSVSVRLPKKTATMIQLLSIALKKPVHSILTQEISEKIAEKILSDISNIAVLEHYIEENDCAEGGFLSVLIERGVIEENICLLD